MSLATIILINLWFAGYVPKFVRVASMYSLSPTVVLRRVAVRRWDELRQRFDSAVGLDQPRIWPSEYRAMLEWRATEGRPPTPGALPEVSRVTKGALFEMTIEGVMPTSTCFLQVRAQLCAATHTSRASRGNVSNVA